ncbi:hypothetical protein Tco_0116993 [Tanacetum coccineum]
MCSVLFLYSLPYRDGYDTSTPMLIEHDFRLLQQRIRTVIGRALAEGMMGTLVLEDLEFYSDLSPKDKERYNADIRATNILLQGLPKDIYTLINHYTDAEETYGAMFAKSSMNCRNIKMTMSRMQLNSKFVNNMLPEWGRFMTAVKLNRGLRDSNYDQLYAYLKKPEAHANENKMMFGFDSLNINMDPGLDVYNKGQGNNAQGGGATGYGDNRTELGIANPGGQDNDIDEDVDEKPVQDLALNVDNMFQADDCDAFDSDVDEAPMVQTMFMANISSADPVYDKAGPSYDSDILSEVHDHDQYQDVVS